MNQTYILTCGQVQTETTFDEFVSANKDSLLKEEIETLRNLEPGEPMYFGGGAAPVFMLRRIAEKDACTGCKGTKVYRWVYQGEIIKAPCPKCAGNCGHPAHPIPCPYVH